MRSSEESNSVSETQNLESDEKLLLAGVVLLLFYGLTVAPNMGTRLVLFGILAIVLFLWFSKKIMILTFTGDALVIEKRSNWNYFKKIKTVVKLKEIGRITICNHLGSSFTGHRGANFIEFTYRNNRSIFLRYIDINKRASAIKLIRPFLESKTIRLIVYTTIYDPAFETIKDIIKNKYGKEPDKFNPNIIFEGDRYF